MLGQMGRERTSVFDGSKCRTKEVESESFDRAKRWQRRQQEQQQQQQQEEAAAAIASPGRATPTASVGMMKM
jgi:hypothetical protein